jgi:uncharacterized protein with ParB-like and HNH nuclease domain
MTIFAMFSLLQLAMEQPILQSKYFIFRLFSERLGFGLSNPSYDGDDGQQLGKHRYYECSYLVNSLVNIGIMNVPTWST